MAPLLQCRRLLLRRSKKMKQDWPKSKVYFSITLRKDILSSLSISKESVVVTLQLTTSTTALPIVVVELFIYYHSLPTTTTVVSPGRRR